MINLTRIKRPKVKGDMALALRYGLAYCAWLAWVTLVVWVM
jgi:hypothetical protein